MNRVRSYTQLIRLPNVFTALADIVVGAMAGGEFAGGGLPQSWPWNLALLLCASACLYSGGMVWNDFFDLEQDKRERPFRPLPSGRISGRAAAWLGAALLAGGFTLAAVAGSALPAGLLVATVLLYDGWLKRTWAGPLAMGACRFLNVVLGVSLAEGVLWSRAVYLAGIVGCYIVGVTWFARTEARASSRAGLVGAAAVMLASLLLALPLPVQLPPRWTSSLFVYLLVGLGFLLGFPVCRAIAEPKSDHVQAAVKRALFGLVALDSVLAVALIGVWGLAILLLLIPAFILGRWIYST